MENTYPALVSVRIKRGIATAGSPNPQMQVLFGGGKQQVEWSSFLQFTLEEKRGRANDNFFLHRFGLELA